MIYCREMRAALAMMILLSACASSRPYKKDACERDPGHDPECIELLTTPPDTLETREEVLRREEERKDDAFSDRLARLRADEEERQKLRGTKSTTVADDVALELDPEDAAALTAVTPKHEESESGSSVRALAATHQDAKMSAAPTPEDYLRGSQCMLSDDTVRMRAMIPASKSWNRANAGALAMGLIDAESLLSSVKAELEHRKLPLTGHGICAAETTRRMVELLRELVGPRVQREVDAEPYGRGVARLQRELEVKAGLPKSE
jgi:hypothetical protein